MKIKSLLITLGLASIACVGWYVMEENANEAPAYIPRSEFNKAAAGADGAFEYYRSVKANIYTGEIEPEDIYAMRKALKKIAVPRAKNDNIFWESLGPDNVGGRTRAILPFPNNPSTLIAGGVSGGLFKSTNSAQTWQPLPNFDENLAVSSIAMLGNGAIYVGTGNSRENPSGNGGSGFIGGGLFVSYDEGNTWNLVSDFEPSPFDPSSDWAVINTLKADPNVPNKLWIGTNIGLRSYTDGAADVDAIATGLAPGVVKDFDISADGDHFLVMINNTLYVSTDGGANFDNVDFDGPSQLGNGATEVVISRTDKNFMAVSVAQSSGFLKGVYASTNAGATWNIIAPQSNAGGVISQFAPFYNGISAQGWYDNMITSVPLPNQQQQLLLGGIRIWRWDFVGETPGITAWEEVNSNFASFPGGPPNPFYVHSDIHTDAWDPNNVLYLGTDGGIFRSSDLGASWNELNKDYVTTQYYSIAFGPDGKILGGLQDNGTLLLTMEGSNPEFAVRFSGGDGFDCEISQLFPEYMFSTLYFGTVFRSVDGGDNITAGSFGNLDSISLGGGSDFNTDIAFWENENSDFSEIFVRYSPTEDDPYLVFLPEPQATVDGDTIIARIPAGSEILVEADNNDYLLPYTVEEDINFYSYYVRTIDGEEFEFENIADTALVRETPQFLLATALSGGASTGIYVTRQPMKTNGEPKFYNVDPGLGSSPTSIEWSPDGDHLYVGYASGQLLRISNFNEAWTRNELSFGNPAFALTRTIIHQGFGAITDIEVDYSLGKGSIDNPASERVAITIGGYGGSGKVRISPNAASTGGFGTFENVWNVPAELQGMPVYSVVMDVNDPNILLVGTEYGIYYSGDNGNTWSEANNGDMVRVPVFDLRQQKMEPWRVSNGGVVYAGSHGRGVFRTQFLGTSTDIDDIASDEIPVLNGLNVFPNPVASEAALVFDLGVTAEVDMFIYSLDGKLVKAIQDQRIEAGKKRQVRFNVSDMSTGSYLVQLRVGDTFKTSKFVVSR